MVRNSHIKKQCSFEMTMFSFNSIVLLSGKKATCLKRTCFRVGPRTVSDALLGQYFALMKNMFLSQSCSPEMSLFEKTCYIFPKKDTTLKSTFCFCRNITLWGFCTLNDLREGNQFKKILFQECNFFKEHTTMEHFSRETWHLET